MKVVVFISVLFFSTSSLTGCSITTGSDGPGNLAYSGYTVGYGYKGGSTGGLAGYGSYGGWDSSYYAPSL